MHRLLRVLPFAGVLLFFALYGGNGSERQGHRLTPEVIPATDERIAGLKLPGGFRIAKFADGLGNPRMLAAANDGAVYVTRREEGDCVMLVDSDQDGRADDRRIVARRPGLHGIVLRDDAGYFATVREVFRADRKPDGSFGPLQEIMDGLPEGGRHPNRTLGIGPDGMLYVTVGSTCNACREENEESATILRAPVDGGRREIFARGLRNTLGFGWHPDTNQLWGLDHGTDWMGDNMPPEELNRLEKGARYGWPYVAGNGQLVDLVPSPPGDASKAEWAKMTRDPVLTYTAHAAPMQMVFYTGNQFPAEHHGDAFAGMHGSWNRKPPSGYELVRIRFKNGKPERFEPFVTGFLSGQGDQWTTFGRPAGIALAADGSLLFSDDANGVIYRVWWTG